MKKLTIPISVLISIIIAGLMITGAIFYTKKPKSVELPKKEKVTQEASPKEELSKPEFKITEKDHIPKTIFEEILMRQ